MNYADMQRIKRLEDRFKLNFKITRLYAAYLESCPDAITKDLIDELCGDGQIEIKDAVCALLCNMLSLDMDSGAEERRLIMDYVIPSVRILNAREYTENPYCKKIAPKEDIKLGDWEFKWEVYPPYRAAICDDMILKDDYLEIPPLGFFTEELRFPAVLEGGNEWMTLTPVDVDTCRAAIEAAHGKVVTFGLGLGYFTYMASQKADVKSVTVIERSEEVIKLFSELILPRFEHPEKIRIICEDAFEYARKKMSGEGFDYAFVDTWRDASDGAPTYLKMKELEKLSKGTKFDYWIENFLISRLRAERFVELMESLNANAPDAPGSYDEFVERLSLNNGTCTGI